MMKKRFLKRRISRSVGGDAALTLFLLLVGCIMGVPLVFAISMALKSPYEFWLFPPTFFPRNPTLKNFSDLFTVMSESWVPMSRYLFNSLFITVAGTLGHIILASMAAFVLSKYQFPGTKFLFAIVQGSLMFSTAVTGIPSHLILTRLGMIDTYWTLIIPAMGSSLGLFLMKQFIDQMVPSSVIESAEIDGASLWCKFLYIVMPMVKPAWLTLMIFSIQALWGIGGTSYIYSEQLKTFPYALSQLATSGIARAGVGAATTIILLFVPLSVFIVSQSNIIETMSASGIKE